MVMVRLRPDESENVEVVREEVCSTGELDLSVQDEWDRYAMAVMCISLALPSRKKGKVGHIAKRLLISRYSVSFSA